MVHGAIFGISFLISIILLILLYKFRNVRAANYLFLITLLIAFWTLMELLSLIQNPLTGIYFQKLRFISLILIPPLYLMETYEYTGKTYKWKIFKLLFFVVPGISLLSLATNTFPYKFISDIKISYLNGAPVFSFTTDIGFLIQIIYSYTMLTWGCLVLLFHAINSPLLYRRQSEFIFVGTLITFVINFIVLSLKPGSTFIDLTSVSALSTVQVFYFGLFHFPKSVIQPFARDLVVENIKDIVFILDSQDRIIDLNPEAVNFCTEIMKEDQKKPEANVRNYIGLKLEKILQLTETEKKFFEKSKKRHLSGHSIDLKHKNRYFQTYESDIKDKVEAKIGKIFILHDMTQVQEYMNSLEILNEEMMISDRIINSATEGVMITDADSRITRINHSLTKISGYEPDELIGNKPNLFKSGYQDKSFYANLWESLINEGHWEGEIWNKKKNGEVFPCWITINALNREDGTTEHYIGIITDISKIKKTEEALENLAYYDPLTGLPNRRLFYERLGRSLVRKKRNGKKVVLFIVDLDEFKIFNDSLGHDSGDKILKEVAKRIKSIIREVDTVSRIDGDVFTIILEDIENIENVISKAESLIKIISQPFLLNNREIILSSSIGIAIASNDDTSVEGLVRKAEAAKNASKYNGKGRYSFSSEEIEKRNRELFEMQTKLHKALTKNEFRLYLQPLVFKSENGYEIAGAEALIRWKTDDGIIHSPDKFIPFSENNGLILPIGNWVLEEIFRIDKVLKSHNINLKLSINISSKQLESGYLVNQIKDLITKNASQKIDLVIEVTESFLLINFEEAIKRLQEIKQLGIKIALDDFGTGFSSLSYLTRLPIDFLKIDKSFIHEMIQPDHKDLTPSILSIAKILNLKTVAEGVETWEQINMLLSQGCDELQGFYFSKPVDLDTFIKFVHEFSENQG